jgi:diguanylate cyclase (GGDEF)-like protein
MGGRAGERAAGSALKESIRRVSNDAPSTITPEISAALANLWPLVLSHRGDMLAVKDVETGRYVWVDGRLSAFVGRSPADVLGATDADLFDASLGTMFRAAEKTALSQGEPLRSDHAFEWKGERHDFSVLRCLVAGPTGVPTWLCSVWSDQRPAQRRAAQLTIALQQLEQQQRANEQLRRELADQTMRDQASGLHARGHFEEQLRRELDLSTREHREFAVVFIEIDPAAAEVAALGEPAQERIFEAVGRLLRSGTRAMDASCRWEARRFSVLLSGVGLATAHSRMEGLRRQCATQIVLLAGQELRFSVSMGIASFPHTASDKDALLASCEAALVEARRRGGNQVTLAAIRLDAA